MLKNIPGRGPRGTASDPFCRRKSREGSRQNWDEWGTPLQEGHGRPNWSFRAPETVLEPSDQAIDSEHGFALPIMVGNESGNPVAGR